MIFFSPQRNDDEVILVEKFYVVVGCAISTRKHFQNDILKTEERKKKTWKNIMKCEKREKKK